MKGLEKFREKDAFLDCIHITTTSLIKFIHVHTILLWTCSQSGDSTKPCRDLMTLMMNTPTEMLCWLKLHLKNWAVWMFCLPVLNLSLYVLPGQVNIQLKAGSAILEKDCCCLNPNKYTVSQIYRPSCSYCLSFYTSVAFPLLCAQTITLPIGLNHVLCPSLGHFVSLLQSQGCVWLRAHYEMLTQSVKKCIGLKTMTAT